MTGVLDLFGDDEAPQGLPFLVYEHTLDPSPEARCAHDWACLLTTHDREAAETRARAASSHCVVYQQGLEVFTNGLPAIVSR